MSIKPKRRELEAIARIAKPIPLKERFTDVKSTQTCSVFLDDKCVKCEKPRTGFNTVCGEGVDEHLG